MYTVYSNSNLFGVGIFEFWGNFAFLGDGFGFCLKGGWGFRVRIYTLGGLADSGE